MAAITANTGSNNWNTNGAWVGSVQPTAADDVIIPASAVVTIPTATTAVARSVTVQASGTLAFASTTAVLTIGDATAGAGSVALSVSATATITLTGIGTINYISTSATVQTITTGGKTLPNETFNPASNGSWQFSDAHTTSGIITVSRGTLDTNNYSVTASSLNFGNNLARTLTLGSSVITLTATSATWTGTAITNLTVSSNTAVVTITGLLNGGSSINAFGANWNGLSFVLNGGVVTNTTTNTTLNNVGTVQNFTITGTAQQAGTYQITDNFTVNGTFTVTGNSSIERPFIKSSAIGTTRTITAATVSITNVDFQDITGAGAGSWTGTTIGNCLGNSGITFTTPVAQTMASGGSWIVAANWTSRVPLPQDDVTVTGSAAVTFNSVQAGANLDFSGYTGTMTLSSYGNFYFIYGNVTLGSGMSWGAGPNTFYVGLAGRGTHTITSNGKAFFPAGSNSNLFIYAPGGSYSLQDDLSANSPITANFSVANGTFNSNNYAMAVGRFISTSGLTRTINLGTSTVSIYQTAAAGLLIFTATGLTTSMLGATFTVVNVSANTRTIDLGGSAIGTLNYTLSGSTGQLTITQTGYIDTLNFSDATNARTLAITSGQTLSVENFNVVGASGRVVTLTAVTAGSKAYLEVMGSQASTDWLSVKDIYGVIPNKLYVGTNSTDVSGNTNVEFTALVASPYVSRRADIQVASAASATATFAYGLAPQAGRKIVAFYGGSTNVAGTITPPTGFTQIGTTQGTAPWLSVWEGTSDGTQTSLTFSKSGTVAAISGLKIYSIAGFTGTATFDVSDSNSATAVTSLNSAGSAPSNTANPALALMVLIGSNTLGNSVSATNSFGVMRDSTELTALRTATKALFSNAAVSTTYTWTTARNAQSILVVFKDVSSTAYNQPLADTASSSDAATIANIFIRAINDSATSTDATSAALAKMFADSTSPTDALAKTVAYIRSTSDSVTVVDNITSLIYKLLALSDSVTATDSLTANILQVVAQNLAVVLMSDDPSLILTDDSYTDMVLSSDEDDIILQNEVL